MVQGEHRFEPLFVQREDRLFVGRGLVEDRVDRLVDSRQADRPGRRPAGAVDQLQIDRRLLAGAVFLVVEFCPDLKGVRLLDIQHAPLRQGAALSAKSIGSQLDGAKQVGGQIECIFAPAVHERDRVGENGLPILHQIDQHRLASAADRQDVHRLAPRVHGPIGSHEKVVIPTAHGQLDLFAAGKALRIGRADRPRNLAVFGRFGLEFDGCHSGCGRGNFVVEPADDQTSDRRPSVGVGGHEIHDIRDARDEAARLGDHLDPQRTCRHHARNRPRFRLTGRIDDRRRHAERRFLRRFRQLRQRGGDADRERGPSAFVGANRGGIGRFFPVLQRCELDVNRRVGYRFAEKVVGLHRAGDRFARLVVGPLGVERHLELGQDVFFHLDRAGRGRVADLALDPVRAQQNFIGQRAVGRRDAVAARHVAAAEDDIPFRIGDEECDPAADHRRQVGSPQGQAADADRIAWPIDRLVGADHHLPRSP